MRPPSGHCSSGSMRECGRPYADASADIRCTWGVEGSGWDEKAGLLARYLAVPILRRALFRAAETNHDRVSHVTTTAHAGRNPFDRGSSRATRAHMRDRPRQPPPRPLRDRSRPALARGARRHPHATRQPRARQLQTVRRTPRHRHVDHDLPQARGVEDPAGAPSSTGSRSCAPSPSGPSARGAATLPGATRARELQGGFQDMAPASSPPRVPGRRESRQFRGGAARCPSPAAPRGLAFPPAA